ncbi:MAG: GNAT family N-acetyltransferase [Gammaproteobacteria bacterium]|nr:GNAT family N-acetyltransferase [Gammaproteobacteria bacterium]
MLRILNLQQTPHLNNQLQSWFQQEWGEIDPMFGDLFPQPLVAVDENGGLAGGLAFTLAPEPNGSHMAVWINAIMVSPPQRGRGVASKLIQAATERAWAEHDLNRLFVNTDIPLLYEKNGWSLVKKGKSNSVLTTVKTKS